MTCCTQLHVYETETLGHLLRIKLPDGLQRALKEITERSQKEKQSFFIA